MANNCDKYNPADSKNFYQGQNELIEQLAVLGAFKTISRFFKSLC